MPCMPTLMPMYDVFSPSRPHRPTPTRRYYDYNDGSCQSSFYDGLVGKGLQVCVRETCYVASVLPLRCILRYPKHC